MLPRYCKDPDYSPPHCSQNDKDNENSLTKQPQVDHLEKEQIAGLLFENKIKRYPLRNYVNLSTGTNVQYRPNYYESGQEVSVFRRRKVWNRRHSISAPQGEEKEEERPNLCQKIGLRRHSDGFSHIPLNSEENEVKDLEKTKKSSQTSNKEPCCAIITRVFTYTSKKGVVKLVQTEQLNEELPQSSVLRALVKVDHSVLNKRPELEDSSNNFKSSVISNNEQYNTSNFISGDVVDGINTSTVLPFKFREGNSIQKEVENYLYSELQGSSCLSEQTNFLARCALKRQNQLDPARCEDIQTNRKAEATQTKDRKSLQANKESVCRNDAVRVQFDTDRVQTNPKSRDTTRVASEKFDERPASAAGQVKIKTNVHTVKNDNKAQRNKLNPKNIVVAKEKKPLQELLQEHRENLFKPDMLLRRDTVLVKIPSKEPSNKNVDVKKPSVFISGLVIQKKMYKNKLGEEKNTKHRDKVKKTNNVQAAIENIPLQEAVQEINTTKTTNANEKPLYDIDEIERKLKQIFGEENDNAKQSVNNTNTVQDESMDKSTKYCVLCKKKTKWEEKTNQELAELKKRESLSKDKATSSSKNKDPENIIEEIKMLQKKRNELKKIKTLLESILCSKETCIRQCSNSTSKNTKEKSTNATRNQNNLTRSVQPNITHKSTTGGEKSAKGSLQQVLVKKNIELPKKKSNPVNLNKPRIRKPVKVRTPPQKSKKVHNLLKKQSTVANVTCDSIMEESQQQSVIKDSYAFPEQLVRENIAYEVIIEDSSTEDHLLEDQSNSENVTIQESLPQNSMFGNQASVENVLEEQIEQFQHNLLEEPSNSIITTAVIERQPVVDPTEDWLFAEQTSLENVPHSLGTEEQTVDGLTLHNGMGNMYMPNRQSNIENVQPESTIDQIKEQSHPNSIEQFSSCPVVRNASIVREQSSIESLQQDLTSNYIVEEQNMEESTQILKDIDDSTRDEQSMEEPEEFQPISNEQFLCCLSILNDSIVEEETMMESNQDNCMLEEQNIEDSTLILKENVAHESTKEQSQSHSREQFSTCLNILHKSAIKEQNTNDSILVLKENVAHESRRERSQSNLGEQFSNYLNILNTPIMEEQTAIEFNQPNSMFQKQNIEDSTLVLKENVTYASIRKKQSQSKAKEQLSTDLNIFNKSIIEERTNRLMLEEQNIEDSTLGLKENVTHDLTREEQSQSNSREQLSTCLNILNKSIMEEQTIIERNQNVEDSTIMHKENVARESTGEQFQSNSREQLSTCLDMLNKSIIEEQRMIESNKLVPEQQNVDSTEPSSHESTREEQSQPNLREQYSSCPNIRNKTIVGEQRMIEPPQDSTNNSVIEEQSKESTQLPKDKPNNENVPQESATTSSQHNNSSKNQLNHNNVCCESATEEELKEKEEKHNLLKYLESCCSSSTTTECPATDVKPKPEDNCDTNLPPKQEELLPTDKTETLSPKHSCDTLEESDSKENTECCCCLKKEEKLIESNGLLDKYLTAEKHEDDSTDRPELETNIIISDEDDDIEIVFSSIPKKRRRNCLNIYCKNCSNPRNLKRKRTRLDMGVIVLDDEGEHESVDNFKQDGAVIVLDEDVDEVEKDKEIEELPSAPTNPIGAENTTETEGIDSSLAARLTQDDVIVRMTEMEHYKKRLIHQHEKPDTLSPPCTTTEEEDDSLESPLSPASNGQPREAGQGGRRKDEAVQKVTRKRAVCRSQFRHQNLEIFKLGKSIPTSLCKSKEPYNVCTEKNLQMCYQNGSVKKSDKPSPKGLTESIINTMEGGKRREVPLWRSTSLNNEPTDKQNSVSNSSGRHILPAIVPELPERRKGRAKSLQESNGKNSRENHETPTERVGENAETRERPSAENEGVTEKEVQGSGDAARVIENVTEAHSQNATIRRQSTSSESEGLEYAPMNLSMKKRDSQSWEELLHSRQARLKEVNSNQHLTSVIPKQPSNIPKKPAPQSEPDVSRSVLEQNVSNLEGTRVDKDGNCYFLTAIPTEALDPQKKSNFIVINFPQIQQQMARMETPPVPVVEVPHSPMEVLDSAIMSLINIVRSSVETIFNPMSLPVLNRLYVDLNRYLLLPTVSVKMKVCIEDSLNTLIVYLLVNWFHAPQTSKTRDFVHRLMQLDLRPHVEFLSRSLEMIRRQIKDEDFRDHLLQILSRRPPEFLARRPSGDPQVLPQQRQYFGSTEFREFPPGRFWGENVGYQRGNVVVPHPNLMGNVVQAQQQQRARRQAGKPEGNVLRGPEGFNGSNLAVARPSLHQPDNRCIPPQMSHHADPILMNAPNQAPPKGRPRNPPRINKLPIKPNDNSFGLPTLPPVSVPIAPPIENQTHRWTKPVENLPISPLTITRRNSDVSGHRDVTEDTSPLIKKLRHMNERQTVQEIPPAIDVPRNVSHGNNFQSVPHRSDLPVSSENISHSKVFKPAEKPAKIVPVDYSEPKTVVTPVNSNRDTVLKQCPDSDVEQFLQTNIIVNNHQSSGVIRESVLENLKQVNNKRDNATSDSEKLANLPGKAVTSDKSVASSSELAKSVPETIVGVDKPPTSNRTENRLNETPTDEIVSVSSVSASDSSTSTVIIKDKSMEISRSDTTLSGSNTSSSVKNNTTDLDDVVLERVSSDAEMKDGVSHTLSVKKSEKQSDVDKGIVGEAQKLLLEEDVSIEKVTNNIQDVLPRLTKLTTLKRKINQEDKQPRKKVKWHRMFGETLNGEIVVIEDDDKETTAEKLDCNQNNVTKTENNSNTEKSVPTPVIEDISDEETFEPFRLYSTYDTKINGDPRKILQTTEVSHCTLIEGSVEAIQKANPELFEKPPVYTRPVMPRNLREERETPPKRKLLTDMVQFKEDPDSMTCSLIIKNDSNAVDVTRFSPLYKIGAEGARSPRFSPSFKSTPQLGVVQTSPSVPRSPLASPIVQTRLITNNRNVTPPECQRPPPPPLDESRMNWRHWFADEQRKGMFNFERSQSTESARSTEATGSDYGSNFSPDESFFEIEIDSKMRRIRKSLYDKIPKGKLCYVRESNTFIRYFDDNQMELFIRNLSAGEKSPVAENLLRQVRGPSEVVSPGETSGKGEVIRLSRDVAFSSEDYLSLPELYVEEVEKVERYVPKDFYGFYMYVTGYQIVNRHFPISFQTFLAMHNTNGIKVLFKNYVNSLIENKNVL